MGKNLNCLVKYAVSLFIIFAKTNEINMTACSVSLPTLQKVSKCPTTEKELLAAKESKDCQSLAEVQKCVRPQNFTYHCVINFSANEIYEVCAPAIYSQGRCLEFNIYGRVIQEIQNASCVKDGCPKRFSSADTLQYADCSTSIKKKSSNTCTCSNWKEEFIAFAVFSGVLLLLLLVVLPSLLCLQKKFPRCFRGITCNEGCIQACNQVCNQKETSEDNGLSSNKKANVKNLNGEEIDDAVQIITNEYESRKRRKRKLRSPEDPSRLEKLNKDSYENTEREPLAERARRLTTTSTKSSDSTVTVKRGYDKDTFVYFLKRHNLKDCEENLRKSKIDCLQTFLELNEEKLEQLGLEYGQVRKCLKAIGEAIGEATTKPKKETLAT